MDAKNILIVVAAIAAASMVNQALGLDRMLAGI